MDRKLERKLKAAGVQRRGESDAAAAAVCHALSPATARSPRCAATATTAPAADAVAKSAHPHQAPTVPDPAATAASLCAAAAASDARALDRLLHSCAARHIDSLDPNGRAPLHHAASHAGALETLLLAGADANTADSAKCTPLHAAAGMSDVHAVQLLLNHGADAGAADSSGRTPLAHAAAACRGHSEAVLALARHWPQLLAQRSWAGNTPLHELCDGLPSNSCGAALLALAEGGLLTSAALTATDSNGCTPLALAAAAGSDEAVGVLLGCWPSALHAYCQQCSRAAVRSFAPGGKADGDDEEEGDAGSWGSVEAVAAATRGHTCALGCAAAGQHYEVMLILMEAEASAAGLSPHILGRAVADARADVAGALLAAGLRCSPLRPLLAVVESDNAVLLRALLRAGLDPNCPGKPGNAEGALRLLQAALQPGREPLLQALLPLPPPVRQAEKLRQGSPQRRAAELAELLRWRHLAERWRHLDVAELAHRLQYNPALYAIRHSSLPALRLLLAAGCPAGAVPASGSQPLLVAAAWRLDTACIRALLEAGAVAGEVDQEGRSALDAVCELATDPGLIELAAEETHGAAAATEHQLLALIELLVGAGAPCRHFLAEHGVGGPAGQPPARQAPAAGQPPPPLVHRSLVLALGVPLWSPATHSQWPAAFRQAASALLLVLRGRGVAAAAPPQATAGVGGGSPTMRALFGRKRTSSSGSSCGSNVGGASGMYTLPVELCHLILSKAALPVSCWLPAG